MRLFPAELAMLRIEGKLTAEELPFLTLDEAWSMLHEEVARGRAPPELGDDIKKWAAWVDYNFTRLHRLADGTAYFRFQQAATAIGKYSNEDGIPGFVQVTLSVVPTPSDLQVAVDTSQCLMNCSCQPDTAIQDSYFTAIIEGIRDYASKNRLVGMIVTVNEIIAHPIEGNPLRFKIALSHALDEVQSIALKEAI
jgi:hypothetical protein